MRVWMGSLTPHGGPHRPLRSASSAARTCLNLHSSGSETGSGSTFLKGPHDFRASKPRGSTRPLQKPIHWCEWNPFKMEHLKNFGRPFSQRRSSYDQPGVAQTTKEGYVLFVYQGTLSRLNKWRYTHGHRPCAPVHKSTEINRQRWPFDWPYVKVVAIFFWE